MIISRTPFRISFFGGGTDYPDWYGEHGGAVLATTIDKYCYISVRELPPFFDHRFRVVYSIVENVKEIGEIQHPAVRGVLEWLKVEQGPRDSSRRRSAGALGPRLELGVHRRPDQRRSRARRPPHREGDAGERGDSRRAVRAARACRAAGSGLRRVRRLQPHRDRAEWNLQRHADGPAARSAARAAEPSDARLHRHLAHGERSRGDGRHEHEEQSGRHADDAADGGSGDRASCRRRKPISSSSASC